MVSFVQGLSNAIKGPTGEEIKDKTLNQRFLSLFHHGIMVFVYQLCCVTRKNCLVRVPIQKISIPSLAATGNS